jgi:hypothetical protein
MHTRTHARTLYSYVTCLDGCQICEQLPNSRVMEKEHFHAITARHDKGPAKMTAALLCNVVDYAFARQIWC